MTWQVSFPVVWKIARDALLGHRGKPVRRPRRQDGVDRGLRVAVGAVLEADRHRQSGRQLAVDLALGRARADRPPRGQVGDVLRDLRVEELGSRRQAEIVDVEQQLARQPQSLVDVEALVQIGIVDQALPPDRPCAASRSSVRITTIKRSASRSAMRLAAVGVLERRRGVVDRAGPDDDHQARIAPFDDRGDRGAGVGDDIRGALADRDLLEKDRRRDQRPNVADAEIVGRPDHEPVIE